MTKCQQCQAKSQLYLCPRCTTDLQDMLTGLALGQQLPTGQHAAGWIEYLEDAAYGRTRLGESARRSTDTTTPLPVNLTASQLLDNLHAMLIHWVETINLHTETLALPEKYTQ